MSLKRYKLKKLPSYLFTKWAKKYEGIIWINKTENIIWIASSISNDTALKWCPLNQNESKRIIIQYLEKNVHPGLFK